LVAARTPNGYADIQEVFGSHYELPELGPLGSNGMALLRDFEHPVASFDMDTTEWESVFPRFSLYVRLGY
jgi:homogentisate 1,2-dioxygenase